MKPVVRHNRGALVSRIGEVIDRRRNPVTVAATPHHDIMGGGVDALTAEYQPVTEFLGAARMLGREHRQTQYLHVSDLLGKCIRKIAIFESLSVMPRPQALSLMDSITYAQGDAIGDVLKARVAAGSNGRMWGNWECRCKTTHTSAPCLMRAVDMSVLCRACKTPMTRYVEVPMRNEEYRIVGSPDVLTLYEPGNALHITELKSITHERWLTLVRPDPIHVLQVVFYWFLMRELGYRLTDKVSVVYGTKGWIFGKSPAKEFVLAPEPELPRIEPYLQDARRIQQARAGGELPTRVCASDSVTEAKKCEVCRTCFGGSGNAPIEVSITQALGRSSTNVIRRARQDSRG